jgi:hypothetical protein
VFWGIFFCDSRSCWVKLIFSQFFQKKKRDELNIIKFKNILLFFTISQHFCIIQLRLQDFSIYHFSINFSFAQRINFNHELIIEEKKNASLKTATKTQLRVNLSAKKLT